MPEKYWAHWLCKASYCNGVNEKEKQGTPPKCRLCHKERGNDDLAYEKQHDNAFSEQNLVGKFETAYKLQ